MSDGSVGSGPEGGRPLRTQEMERTTNSANDGTRDDVAAAALMLIFDPDGVLQEITQEQDASLPDEDDDGARVQVSAQDP